jgi:hypothetical protein
MKIFGQIKELTKVIFKQNGYDISLDSNSGTTYTGNKDFELPPGDNGDTLVGEAATQVLTNKTIDGDDNTVQDLPVTALKTVLGDADEVILRDAAGVPTSAKIVDVNVDAAAGINATKIGNGDVDNTELSKLNGLSGNITTDSNSQTLTNKTIDGDDNTLQDIPLTAIKTELADADKVVRRDASGIIQSGNTIPNTSALVTTDSSQVITNKDIDGGTASNSLRITVPKNTTTNLNALTRKQATLVYDTDLNKLLVDDGSALNAVGAGGSGEVNMILDPYTAAGWSETGSVFSTPTTDTMASIVPPSVSTTSIRFVASGSGPITSDYVSVTTATGQGLNNTKLKLEFYMTGGAGFADGEWEVGVYLSGNRLPLSTDVAGATLLPNIRGKFTAYFDYSSIATSALVLRFARVSGAGPANLLVTGLIIGPGIQPANPIVTEWQTYTASFTNGSIVASQDLKYRRVGSSMEITGSFDFNGAGGMATAFGVSIPSGLTIDSSAFNDAFGAATFGGFSGLTATGSVGALSSTQIYFFSIASITVNGIFRDDNATNGANIGFTASIPINEWAGSGVVQLAENAVEYAFNTDTANSNDTTSFGYGSSGQQFGNYSGGTRIKRVQFQSPILVGDKITVEITQDSGVTWQEVADCGIISPWTIQNGTAYGMSLSPATSTQVDVSFGNHRFADAATYGGGGSDWSGIDADPTYRWRVKKTSQNAALGFAEVNSVASGLAPATSTLGRVFVRTGNGSASTNTAIGIFSVVEENVGTDITYATSVTLGDSFTINTSGVYAISHTNIFNTSNVIGISRNATQLSTGIESLTNQEEALASSVTNANNEAQNISATIYLEAGDVIRAHNNAAFVQGANPERARFIIQRLS